MKNGNPTASLRLQPVPPAHLTSPSALKSFHGKPPSSFNSFNSFTHLTSLTPSYPAATALSNPLMYPML